MQRPVCLQDKGFLLTTAKQQDETTFSRFRGKHSILFSPVKKQNVPILLGTNESTSYPEQDTYPF